MAKREAVTIVVGGKEVSIRPLTLNQVEAVETAMQPAAAHRSNTAMAREVISIGLSRDYADFAAEVRQGEIETDPVELGLAMTVILRQGGFLPAGPGEASAAAGNAPTGETSAAA